MERKRAIVLAGTATAVIIAAVLAVGATFGMFGVASGDDGPGSFDPVAVTSSTVPATEQTIVVDVPIASSSTSALEGRSTTTASTVAPTIPPPPSPTVSVASTSDDDDEDGDDDFDDDSGSDDSGHGRDDDD